MADCYDILLNTGLKLWFFSSIVSREQKFINSTLKKYLTFDDYVQWIFNTFTMVINILCGKIAVTFLINDIFSEKATRGKSIIF